MTTLVACGGATADSAPKAPSSMESGGGTAEPQTVEEAQAELERARAALSGNVGGFAAAGATPSASSTPQTNPSSGTSQPDTPRPASSPVAPQVAPPGGGARALSTCDQVCRAVTSMHHAKEAICRLAGSTDTRCADAQRKVADGDAQAASCSCPVSKKS